MWRNPYARPDARRAITSASVWFTAYPISLITRPGESFLGSLGDGALWEAFQQIGIDAVHTGPVKRAGGLSGWMETPSVDGHFDRISTRHRPRVRHRGRVPLAVRGGRLPRRQRLDDIVPGHTGKGADFRLAEMAYEDYPGIYHMVEIPEEDWHLLPDVPEGRDAVNLDAAAEQELADHGYIIGALQRVIFYAPGIKETNWSATAPVTGVDGRVRRWVYLHYFKRASPRSTGSTPRSPACAWSSATRCTPSATSARTRCGSTPTASSAWRRAPRACRPGRRATRSRTPRTT